MCLYPSCNYTTHSYSTNLRNHLFSHFGPNPFVCGRCEYRSERFDSLRKHCRVHTGERPYACPICGYRSKTNSNLHAHIRTRHKKPSGKTEQMPSICAEYETPSVMPSLSEILTDANSPSKDLNGTVQDVLNNGLLDAFHRAPMDYSSVLQKFA